MKKLVFALAALGSFNLMAQGDLSPSIIRNIEFLFDDNFIDYTRISNFDPSFNPADTVVIVDLEKDHDGYYRAGREWVDTIYANWQCQKIGKRNEIYIVDAFIEDTAQIEKIYFDRQGKDSLYEIYTDTAGFGIMSLVQRMELWYGSNGLDSVLAGSTSFNGIGKTFYQFHRDANARLDSIQIWSISGSNRSHFQTYRHVYSNNALSHIAIYTVPFRAVLDRIDVSTNNGQVLSFVRYRRQPGMPWNKVDRFFFSNESFFSTAERPLVAPSLKLELYPNPCQSFLHIESEKVGQYIIHNIHGQVVKAGDLERQSQISIEGLAPGSYFFRFKGPEGNGAEKVFIKN